MRLALKIPSYILGAILVVILAVFYVYYFTTLPESELNNWIGSLISTKEDLSISVGRINRDIWDHLMFEQVSLQPSGKSPAPAVYISKMELDYDILPLIRSRNEYRSLVIDSVMVEFPSVPVSGKETGAGKWEFRLPVDASIGRVFVNLIEITLSNGEHIRLDGLAFSASAKDDVLNIALNDVSGHWNARNIDIYSVTGNFSYSAGGVKVNNMTVIL
jgi:autotransporter translocation and assembly factor TamB